MRFQYCSTIGRAPVDENDYQIGLQSRAGSHGFSQMFRLFAPTLCFVFVVTACTPSAPTNETPANATSLVPAPASPSTATKSSPASEKTQACMIAGEFNIAGQVIRSRDCTEAKASVPRDTFVAYCEGLANTSKMFGGKAGTITYSETCPTPSQGSCKNFARSGYDAYYYERTADDLADLPESCTLAGGRWGG